MSLRAYFIVQLFGRHRAVIEGLTTALTFN